MADETRRVIDELRRFVGRSMIATALEIQSNLIEDTPKDTSWASANWIADVGSPPESVSTPTNREERLSSVTARRGDQQAGTVRILGYRLDQGPIFIVNGVPYIGRLNDGHSRQAPSGFVQAAIRRGVEAAARSLR